MVPCERSDVLKRPDHFIVPFCHLRPPFDSGLRIEAILDLVQPAVKYFVARFIGRNK
jgi:hypothetical protein